MNYIEKIAAIVVRGIALTLLISALIDLSLVVADFIFVRAGLYLRSEIAFTPRIMFAGFDIIAALFLYYQGKPIINYLIEGLADDEIDEQNSDEKL